MLSFEAKIYVVGINPCVKVPQRVWRVLPATKGFIPVKGKINNHPFVQTLVPVRGEGYRLYVNGPMLKGSRTAVGDRVTFILTLDRTDRNDLPVPPGLTRELKKHKLMASFDSLSPSRRKEILRYLNNLKSKDALTTNISRVVRGLQGKEIVPYLRQK